MSLKQRLDDFVGSVGGAATRAPDEYPEWSCMTYESHMADIKELWAEVRPQLKRDLAQVGFVDGKLQEMFAAFEAGEREKGRDAAWAIYNADLEKLR